MDNRKTTMLIKFTDSKKFRNMQTSKEEIIRANTWVCVSGTELQSLNMFFHSIFKWSNYEIGSTSTHIYSCRAGGCEK